jgi:rfaE bifunctional protein kinase chain/domain
MKTVFVSGVFNVLHPGHIRLFHFARELGDRLVVGVENDSLAAGRAFVQEHFRLEGVRSISLIDEVVLLDSPPEEHVRAVRPAVVVKGREHENRHNPEEEVLAQYGGKLIFSAGDSSFSYQDLIGSELVTRGVKIGRIPSEFVTRRGASRDNLLKMIDSFRGVRALVIGDLIVDEYITTEALGMSGEEPVIVVQPVDSALFLGGAGIVAAHLASLGAHVDFVSVVGDDESARFARHQLETLGVAAHLIVDSSRPTTKKTRYRCDGKSLLRVSKLSQEPVSRQIATEIQVKVRSIGRIELVLFSDFNYGVLSESVLTGVHKEVAHFEPVMGADSQSSSQVGDISRFKLMDFICPTEKEARIATRNTADGLVQLAESVRFQSNAQNVLLTLGADGLIIHARPDSNLKWETDRIPALNTNPLDVAGAGDSLFSTVGLCRAVGGDIFSAAALGAIASAVQVSRIGNIPISVDDLRNGLVD